MTSEAHVRSASEQAANPMSVSVGTNMNSNPWRAYFGDGKPGLSVHPYNEKDETTWVLPYAYRGDNLFLGQTFELMQLTKNNFLTQIIMPLKYTDRLSVRWNKYEFDPTIAPIVPERGTCRLLHSRSYEGGGGLHRRGLGFLLEHGFMRTELGKKHFMYELMAIDASITETHNYEIISALMESGKYAMTYEKQKDTYNEQTIEDRIDWERMTWDIIKTEPHSFEKLSRKISDIMEMYGGSADTWIVDPNILNWLTLTPSEKIEYYRAGPAGPKRISDGVENFVLVSGEAVYAPRGYDVGLESGPHNQMISKREVGEYHLALDPNRGKDYPKSYTTAFRNIMIYSQDNDQNKELGIETLYRLCKRVNPDTGKFYSLYDGVFQFNPSFSPKDHDEDPFMFYRPGDEKAVPIEYFGNMKPGTGPDFADGHLTPDDYISMALTATNNMSHIGSRDKLCRRWDNVVNVIKEIRKQEYDENVSRWVTALITEYVKKDATADGESHPKISGRGIPPKLDVKDIKPNTFGFVDLPKNPDLDNPPPWGNSMSLPPFFSTMYGLRTIAHAYKTRGGKDIRTLYGFSDEWFSRVNDAVEFMDSIMEILNQVAPGSVFKDPKYAPSKDHRPDEAGCLLENLVTGTQHPLFINTNVNDDGHTFKGTVLGSGGVKIIEAPLSGQETSVTILRALTDFGRTLSSTVVSMYNDPASLGPFSAKSPTKFDAFKNVEEDRKTVRDVIGLFSLAFNAMQASVASAKADKKKVKDALSETVELVLRRNVVFTVISCLAVTDKTNPAGFVAALSAVVGLLRSTFVIPTDETTAANALAKAKGISSFDVKGFWEAATRIAKDENTSHGFSRTGVSKSDKSWSAAYDTLVSTYKDLLAQLEDYVGDETTDTYKTTFVADGMEDLFTKKLLRTPLVYTPQQYLSIYKLHTSAKVLPGVWPSSARDPETPATLLEIQNFRKYIDSSVSEFSEHEHLAANLPPALRYSHVYPFSTEVTNVFDGVNRLRRETESNPYVQSKYEEGSLGSLSGWQRPGLGKRKVVSPYDSDLSSKKRSKHARGDKEDPDEPQRLFSPVTTSLSDSLDLDFDRNAQGNFELAFSLLFKQTSNSFFRMIAHLFVGTPANDTAITATLRYNIVHPFNYLVVRPHGRIRAATILKVAKGGRTGHTYYGNNKFTLGDDPATQIHYGALTWYSRPLVEDKKTIFRADNVFTTGYDGGFGIKPMTLESYFPEKGIYGLKNDESIIVIMLPRNVTELPDAMNLTGSWAAYMGSEKEGKLHYPTAVFYNKVWGFKNADTGIEEGSYNPYNDGRKCNFTVLSAKTLYIHPLTQKYDIIRYGRAHFRAEHTGPGAKAPREGGLKMYPVFDYSNLTSI